MDLIYDDGSPAAVSGACALGQALADSIESVAGEGVVAIHHLGTTVCRTIAGTQTLSRHAYGDAIDLQSFEFADGSEYVVEFDWEIGDASPESPGGAWLYDTVHAWHDDLYWTIILTPDYNDAHYNHFHMDLTPGADVLGFTSGRFIGPSPWPGE
ncbi:MAG: extensin family protein [Myxococcota bacterium]